MSTMIRGRRRETVGSMVGSGCFYVFRSESMTGSCVQYHSRAPTEPKRTTLQNSRDVVNVRTCQRGERDDVVIIVVTVMIR